MAAPPTVVFADLTGSTRVFEAMGNARATDTVTRLVQWIGGVCESHHGRVVKTLGDGIFAIFPNAADAVEAVLELQRNHQKRLMAWPAPLRMDLQIGVASGEVVEVDGDSYGDAVNLASRLSDLAGPGQIWATASVIEQIPDTGLRHRNLGPINIRGKTEMPIVHRIDWQEEITEFMTVPAPLAHQLRAPDSSFGQIELSWLDVRSMFRASDLPIHLGRVDEAEFVVNDPRVSRLHARIEARQGSCVLVDVSTYGTWVRFHGRSGASGEIALRRDECVLHGSGEIGLGAPLSDFSAPTIAFNTTGGNVLLARKDAR
ncbi:MULTISPECIES: adenylate/guanylate cyclase domain-containing protein [unclassified Variovorax]|uniref:adenylate/guanylate cyclase domain-containing protein n=1 Tax=unclassified Variovorax TaxID=663243 RepID=UPI001BD1DAB3|nr:MULTISPECIES: adenylate/guanylate cyclase domain-containing protein [unclassified Variovorax]